MLLPSSMTKKDRDEVARITAMLAAHNARSCAECVQIGEHIHRHLERKALPRGMVQRYAKQHFNHDAEYLRRFVRLFVYADELPDAQAWEVASGWHNPYTTEPQRANNLLTNFWKARRTDRIDIGPVRKPITACAEPATTSSISIIVGDCRTVLYGLPDKTYQVCITSPPYHAERDYDMKQQIGSETSISDFIATLVRDVFRPVMRVLRDDGILFVNIGDRVASRARGPVQGWGAHTRPAKVADDLPVGNMLRIPDRLAGGLVNDGWLYRCEIIWEKTQSTQRSDKRPVVTHEKILMLTKSMRYQYYSKAIQEPSISKASLGTQQRRLGREPKERNTKDLGSVWRIPSDFRPHGIAPFPVELARRLISLSTMPGDQVLDPFGGTGTTGLVAKMLGRRCTLIELNPAFAANAERRISAADDPAADLHEAAD